MITAYRNGDDPYAAGQHRGVDIGAPVGTRVVAATGGTVTFAGVAGSSGLVVSERSADGRFDLSYLHLSAASVRRGDAVAAGAPLGAVGTTGRRAADAPHLHFGVRNAGDRNAYRDPLDFLAPPGAGNRPEPSPAPVPVGNPAAADPAPVPAGAPAAADPAPGPLGHPAGADPAPAGHSAPTLGHAPAGTPAHLSSGAHGPAPSGLPRHGPLALPRIIAPGTPAAARPRGGPIPGADAHPSAPGAPARPAGVPAGPYATRTQAGSAGEPHGHPAVHPRSRPHHGINLGWLAACIGLIAAATALGHPDATRRAATRGRTAASRSRAAAARGRASLTGRLRPIRPGRSA